MATDISGSTFSELDASNNTASPNGWPEGMLPSGVNDSARMNMGAVKRAYDRDHAGAWCTVGGTANAITLAYTTGPSAYVTGEKFAFKATAANTGPTTVNVSGLGAKNIFKQTAASAIALVGNEIQGGAIVEIEYDGTQFQIVSGVPAIFAWANVSAAGALIGQNNVTSATKNSTGNYTVTMTNASPDANYAVQVTPVSAPGFGAVATTLAAGSIIVNTFTTSNAVSTDSAFTVQVVR